MLCNYAARYLGKSLQSNGYLINRQFKLGISFQHAFLSTAAEEEHKVRTLLEDHSLKVPSFGGSLWVSSSCTTHVQPIGAIEHPNLDKAFVKVFGSSKEVKDGVKVEVKQEGHKLSVKGVSEPHLGPEDVTTDIEVPIVHNVTVVTTGSAGIKCKDMVESNFCHLTSEEGDIEAKRLKTANLIVQSEGGDVRCKGSMQGSISIVTGDGDVSSDKRFLGPTLDVTTDTGDISVASCYSEQSKFSTNRGNLALRNIHNESYVAVYEEGRVLMQGLDGSTNVFIKKGSLDIHMSQVTHESVIHVEEGDITLKMSDRYPLKVCITANEILVDSTFSKYGEVKLKEDNYAHYLGTIQPDQFSPTCQIMAENGKVSLESQDWAASLGFKLPGGVTMPPDINLKC